MGQKLNEKAMLVSLNIGQWTAKKFDRKVTKRIEQEYRANDSGRFHKILIAQDAIKEVSKTVNTARTFHYENTLPWDDVGLRILTSANYMEYMGKMRDFEADYWRSVWNLKDNYNYLVDEAKVRLNGMWNAADYPDENKLMKKYRFEIKVNPLPDSGDFRVSLQADEITNIQNDMEKRVKTLTANAMQDLWNRLYQNVNHIAERLQDPDKIFRDSLIKNVCGLCELLPRLNINNDPNLEAMRRRVESTLCNTQPDDLRVDKTARMDTAKEAQGILDAMGSYMGV